MTAKYTPDGVRITKTRHLEDGYDYEHKYIVDVSGKLPKILLILDASTEDILKTFIHANNQVIAQHDGDTSDNLYFYTHDRLGSVRQLFDPADLSVKNNYAYDAWGLIVDGETTENIWNPYLFAGYLWDSEISMYYCNARMYDPLLGRFTSRDPVRGNYQEPMTLHVYLYCGNDPVNMTDPEGESGLVGSLIIESKRTVYAVGALAVASTLVVAMNLSYEGLYIATLAAEDVADTFSFISIGSGIRSLGAELAHPAVTYEDHKRQLASLQEQLREAENTLGNAKGPKRKGPIEELIEKLKKMIKGHEKEMEQKWPDS